MFSVRPVLAFAFFAVASSSFSPLQAQNSRSQTRTLGAIPNQSLVKISALQKFGAPREGASLGGAKILKIFPVTGWALVSWGQGATTQGGLRVASNALSTATKASEVFGSSNTLPNGRIKLAATPNDTAYSRQWWPAKIGAPRAWDVQTSAENSVIAVIDTGVQLSHPDLKENLWVNAREIAGNKVDDDKNGYVDDVNGVSVINNPADDEYEMGTPPDDTNGHGTHVAGILAARGNNAREVCGATWRAKILPVRFIGASGYGSDASILAALEYVIALKTRGENIRFTSNSWETPDYNPAIEAAFQKLGTLGVLSVCAAGNGDVFGEGLNIDLPENATYPASFSDASILAVAASTQNDAVATFSNYGVKTVDIAAPGVSIFATGLSSSGLTQSGTSMSTPMVTGAAALLLAKYPTWTAAQIKEQLLRTSTKLSAWSSKTVSGGRLNMDAMFGSIRTASRLTGQVTRIRESDGVRAAVVGAEVKLGSLTTYTDQNGGYAFSSVSPGSYPLSARYPTITFSSQNLSFGVPGSDRVAHISGRSNSASYTISGRAFNASGVAQANVEIRLWGWPGVVARTNSSGFYSTFVPQGSVMLKAKRGGEQFIADPFFLSLPDSKAPSQTAFTVNFKGVPADTTAPQISLIPFGSGWVAPKNGGWATFKTSDTSGVDKGFIQIARQNGTQAVFYNWKTGVWVSSDADPGTVYTVDLIGQTPLFYRPLPTLVAGDYFARVWAVDDLGNETPFGGELIVNWKVAASTTTVLSVSGGNS